MARSLSLESVKRSAEEAGFQLSAFRNDSFLFVNKGQQFTVRLRSRSSRLEITTYISIKPLSDRLANDLFSSLLQEMSLTTGLSARIVETQDRLVVSYNESYLLPNYDPLESLLRGVELLTEFLSRYEEIINNFLAKEYTYTAPSPGDHIDYFNQDLAFISYIDTFNLLEKEASSVLGNIGFLPRHRVSLILASLDLFIALCNKWIRSRGKHIDKQAKLIVRQKRQLARLLFAELSMTLQEKKPSHAWSLAKIPKITDRNLAEQWLQEGLINNIEEVYVSLSPEQEQMIEDRLMPREAVLRNYQPPHAWSLAKIPR